MQTLRFEIPCWIFSVQKYFINRVMINRPMQHKTLSLILYLLSFIFFLASPGFSASPYFDLPRHLPFIEYSLSSGNSQIDFPVGQPYSYETVQSALNPQPQDPQYIKKWQTLLGDDMRRYHRTQTDSIGFWHLGANLYHHTHLIEDKSYGRYRLEADGVYQSRYIVLANKTVVDQGFKEDPLFYGDTGEWIWGRSEQAYALLQWKPLKLFAGRTPRNFGMIGEPSLILSDNPYSYDHFGFEYQSKRFRFSLITSRLNNVWGYNCQAADTSFVEAKRYFSIQRGDLKLRDNLYVGLNQVAIYGGENRTFESHYLNPMNLYYVVQRNNQASISGIWALDCYWKPKQKWTLWGQLLLDDVIVNNEPGQDERAVHPDRLGWTVKSMLADWPFPGSQLSLTYNHVNNWTYMSYRTWENYVYHQKSMGFPFNSYEGFKFEFDYLGNPPFIWQFKYEYARHGEQDINNVFGDKIEKFPRGIVENRSSFQMDLTYMPSWQYYGKISLAYDDIKNELNQPGHDNQYFKALLTLYATCSFDFYF